MNNVFPLTDKKIWVAGHRGMVGSALVRRLRREACAVVLADRRELDLRDGAAVRAFVDRQKPDAILVTAAVVGGIIANDSRPAEFLNDNLAIGSNVIGAAHAVGIPKLVYLGSSCVYPRLASQPIREEELLAGLPEPTNQWYSVAKIAGIKLCDAYRRQHGDDFISVVPTNLYGPGDNFHPTGSHVIPALIRKAHAAKSAGDEEMYVWGSGTPLREFMHVDDAADAIVFLLQRYSAEGPINVGTGEEISIKGLARLVATAVGYAGSVTLDASKPDGAPRKLLDSTRLHALGWRHAISLEEGLGDAYAWYQAALADGRLVT